MVIVVDHEDRENEGDFIISAEKATADDINFMMKYGRGLICTSISSQRAKELKLNLMVDNNTEHQKTNFTVSVDAKDGITTGISAQDRWQTLQVLLNNESSALEDFENFFKNTSGHFSMVISTSKKILCCVDHVRSIPLFYSITNSDILVGSNAPDIRSNLEQKASRYNSQAVIEIAMSGYTIGRKTLDSNVFQLCAGEFLISRNHELHVRKYYQYSPWQIIKRSKTFLAMQ